MMGAGDFHTLMTDTVHVGKVQSNTGPEGMRRSATIRVDSEEFEVYFQSADAPLADGVEPFLALALPAAMATGRRLVVDMPVSPKLLANLPTLQHRFAAQDPALRVVEVTATPATGCGTAKTGRTGMFFSGGVDSFFTLFTHEREIQDLVFVHGYDIRLSDAPLHAAARDSVRNVATATGKRLIHVETNLRQFTNRFGDWGTRYHGPAKGAVALLLTPHLGRIYFNGESIPQDQCDASRPALDPLWSAETIEVLHFGDAHSRLEKLRTIHSQPLVRQHLRVCWENRGGQFNCGVCSKCMRTMACLRALGCLEYFPRFDRPLDLQALSALALPKPLHRRELRGVLEHVETHGTDLKMERAIQRALRRHYTSRALVPLKRVTTFMRHMAHMAIMQIST